MGIRINKAVGWGLTDQQFRENIGFKIKGNDLFETLYDKLNSITTLVAPSPLNSDLFNDGWKGLIMETNILATTPKFMEHQKFPLKSAKELYHSVSDCDSPTEVHLFLPSGAYTNLYRSDNTIDYIESTHDLSTGEYSEPCSYILTELKKNPYPWNMDFMDKDGNQVSRDYNLITKPKFPRPPAELRWWLTSTGILKQDGWKLLRPYYARWWA